MHQDILIERVIFAEITEGLFKYIIPEQMQQVLQSFLQETFRFNDSMSLADLLTYIENQDNEIVRAYLKRLAVIAIAKNSYERSSQDQLVGLHVELVWKLIYESLVGLNFEVTASMGSQGFVSVPLYRMESIDGGLTILRLHIWDVSFNNLSNTNTKNFTIHSHVFDAQSWILCGEIVNTMYDIETSNNSKQSLYKIEWQKSTNTSGDNNKRSHLVNTNIQVDISLRNPQHHYCRDSYTVGAGEFHTSNVTKNFPIHATLFLFSSLKGRNDPSYVVGPADLIYAPEYVYSTFNLKNALEKIEKLIVHGKK